MTEPLDRPESEQLSSLINDADDGVIKVSQMPNRKEDSLLGIRSELISEAWSEGYLSLHVHFRGRPRRIETEPGEYCIIFECLPDRIHRPHKEGIGTPPNLLLYRLLVSGERDLYGQGLVFVNVANALQEPEVRSFYWTAVVGLRPLNECECSASDEEAVENWVIGRGALDRSSNEVLAPIFDGEVRMPAGLVYPLKNDQLPQQMVESGTQIVNEIAEDDRGAPVGRNGSRNDDFAIVPFFNSHGLGVDVARLNFRFESLEVFPGPIELGSDTIERGGNIGGRHMKKPTDSKNRTQMRETVHEIPVPTKEDPRNQHPGPTIPSQAPHAAEARNDEGPARPTRFTSAPANNTGPLHLVVA